MDTVNCNIESFWVAGVNYKKTDACNRGLFAINPEQYDYLLSIAPDYGVTELFVLSTCNRTEIYGVADDVQQLISLLCDVCEGDAETFKRFAYLKGGEEAIQHLFKVAAGLDSQILGDFEILGQIKTSVKFSKAKGFIHSFTERVLNSVMQSSKAIKTNTALSGGTVSVSFAAVQFIKENIENSKDKKIVLLGTGKIGKSTCRNLIHYVETNNITLINRTFETAEALAAELNLKAVSIDSLEAELKDADIIIVSTNAMEPVVLEKHLAGYGNKMVIDLSIPNNVEKSAGELPGITLLNVDVLSKVKDETLEKRKLEEPKAIAIINEHIAEFKEWHDMRKHVPVLKELKTRLKTIHIGTSQLVRCFNSNLHTGNDETIQSVINVAAKKMRHNNAPGCHYIEAINDYIAYHA